MADKVPNPVPGTKGAAEAEAERGTAGSSGAGESGGGAYPNPHEGNGSPDDGVMGHGGQTDIAYSGPEQLGEEQVPGRDNANGVTGAA